MKTYILSSLSETELTALCARGQVDFSRIFPIVDEIERDILARGDAAIRDCTEKFDGVFLEDFWVSDAEFATAEQSVDPELKTAIETAARNIRFFHEKTAPKNSEKIETSPEVVCWREFRALDSAGIYIPGGNAPLFSTLLMLAIPAQIAGVKNIVAATPPQKDGSVAPEILYAAKICGISKILKIGGSQAIFALAHGTKTISKVDKIFGPGNGFVTAAKMRVSQKVAIDMPAGPSEVLVIANDAARADFVAADLLSQAEHGADSQSVLLTFSEGKKEEILREVTAQLDFLPRKEIAEKALQNSFCLVCNEMNSALDFSNRYAPEHLILHCKNEAEIISEIKNAGSVFCGAFSPESVGDYASGTNHTLPTSGFARSFSGVSVESFGKWISFQRLSQKGLTELAPTVEKMAEREGLFAHKNAVSIRLSGVIPA